MLPEQSSKPRRTSYRLSNTNFIRISSNFSSLAGATRPPHQVHGLLTGVQVALFRAARLVVSGKTMAGSRTICHRPIRIVTDSTLLK